MRTFSILLLSSISAFSLALNPSAPQLPHTSAAHTLTTSHLCHLSTSSHHHQAHSSPHLLGTPGPQLLGTPVPQLLKPTPLRLKSIARNLIIRPTVPQPVSTSSLKNFSSSNLDINFRVPDAQGNFGRVFFGNSSIQEQVVVKCPVADDFARTTFETEKAINEKLGTLYSQPRWAKYLGEVTIDRSTSFPADLDRQGISFKFEAGQSLEDYLNFFNDSDRPRMHFEKSKGVEGQSTSGLRPRLAKKVMIELLETCVCLHKVGVVHRDLKPDNIIVTDAEVPLKVIDFGSACDIKTKKGVNDISLDPLYAPPERKILRGVNDKPGKYDVFSVAMIGLRCLMPSFNKRFVTDSETTLSSDEDNILFTEFAVIGFPKVNFDLRSWGETAIGSSSLSASPESDTPDKETETTGIQPLDSEVQELLSDEFKDLVALLQAMLNPEAQQRLDAERALARMRKI